MSMDNGYILGVLDIYRFISAFTFSLERDINRIVCYIDDEAHLICDYTMLIDTSAPVPTVYTSSHMSKIASEPNELIRARRSLLRDLTGEEVNIWNERQLISIIIGSFEKYLSLRRKILWQKKYFIATEHLTSSDS